MAGRGRTAGAQQSSMTLSIRDARPDDVPEILGLIKALAEYERMPDEARATPEQLHRALFGDPGADGPGAGVIECIMGEIDGRVQGMALFFTNFSTWTGQPGIYLEDLIVRPEARGEGLGGALLARLARIALDRRYTRIDWLVLDWNTPAIGFYKSLGAESLDGWTIHRLSGPALQAVAAR
ncbi:MAG: N-acetyltransferase family protein [Phycisphaerales bacterium]